MFETRESLNASLIMMSEDISDHSRFESLLRVVKIMLGYFQFCLSTLSVFDNEVDCLVFFSLDLIKVFAMSFLLCFPSLQKVLKFQFP